MPRLLPLAASTWLLVGCAVSAPPESRAERTARETVDGDWNGLVEFAELASPAQPVNRRPPGGAPAEPRVAAAPSTAGVGLGRGLQPPATGEAAAGSPPEPTLPSRAAGRPAGVNSGGGSGNGKPALERPDPSGDDVVARRLRRAAEEEQDPTLRGKLWQEYVNYKNNSHAP